MADLVAYGGNATFYLTDAGVILVDSKSDGEHDDLLAKLKTLTDKPIKYVILTHNHGDHSGGAAKLQAMGATLLISAADRENMIRGNQQGIPDIGYYRAGAGGTRWEGSPTARIPRTHQGRYDRVLSGPPRHLRGGSPHDSRHDSHDC